MDRFVQAALEQRQQELQQGQGPATTTATPQTAPQAPTAVTPWTSPPTTNPGTAPPWLNSSPPPAGPTYTAGPAESVSSPASVFGKGPPDAPFNFGTKPMPAPTTPPAPTGQAYAGTGEANPGVQMGQQAPWQGGPNVTLTRAGAGQLPGLAAGLDTGGFADFDTDFSGASDRAARGAYEGMTQFMDEDFGQESDALRTQLVNQGLQPGSEAYDREMSRVQRGHDAMRMQAASQAGQIGHQRAGDLLTRALQTRQLQGAEAGQDAATRLSSRGVLSGERERDADRLFNQSMGVAGLGLGSRGQDMGVQQAGLAASGASAAAGASAQSAREAREMQSQLELRRMGMDQDSQDFSQIMALINASRGGVTMPNFGSATPLDVGNAYGIASGNANGALNRQASDRAGMAGLGAALLGGMGNSIGRTGTAR